MESLADHVAALRVGDDAAQASAAAELSQLYSGPVANAAAIAEAAAGVAAGAALRGGDARAEE